MQKELIEHANRIRALAQNGLTYAETEYDTERYAELLEISSKIIAMVADCDMEQLAECFLLEKEYVTPKVDVRAVVFDEDDRILMVREQMDGLWSLPGGWADVGFPPSVIAVKEVKEETGLDVEASRLLAVLDKSCHNHPPALHYAYKLFIRCELKGGAFSDAFDILDKGFFGLDELPPLSTERVTREQIELMYQYHREPSKAVRFD